MPTFFPFAANVFAAMSITTFLWLFTPNLEQWVADLCEWLQDIFE